MALKVFVSCSSNWPQLNDFRELLTTLGHEPIIVEKKESLGKDPDDKSYHYMEQCDKIIFVITADAVDKKGKFHPTSNVAMEIGWSKEKFKEEDKVYILVDNARQPSMINPTYIHFKEGNYIQAINQLIQNLGYEKPAEQREYVDSLDLSRMDALCLAALATSPNRLLARPKLEEIVFKHCNIDTLRFNLSMHKLQKAKMITAGRFGSGSRYAHQEYYKIIGKGLDFLADLDAEAKKDSEEK